MVSTHGPQSGMVKVSVTGSVWAATGRMIQEDQVGNVGRFGRVAESGNLNGAGSKSEISGDRGETRPCHRDDKHLCGVELENISVEDMGPVIVAAESDNCSHGVGEELIEVGEPDERRPAGGSLHGPKGRVGQDEDPDQGSDRGNGASE